MSGRVLGGVEIMGVVYVVFVTGLLSCTIGWMLLEQFVYALRAGRFPGFVDWLARKRGRLKREV